MTTSPALPTVLLVPGLWHGGWAWEKVEQRLVGRGFAVRSVTFPGRDRKPGDETLSGHIAHLRAEIMAVEGPVVVVGHSYGGVPVSAAADHDRVQALVFVSAFPLDVGECIADVVDGRNPGDAAVAADSIGSSDGYLEVDQATALAGFYQDCDPAEADAACARLTPEHPSTRSGRIDRAAWREIRSHYVVCTEDHAITLERQRFLAARLDSVSELPSGHCPMLSHPDELTDLIAAVATETAVRG